MRNTEDRQQVVKNFIRSKKVVAFKQIYGQVFCSGLTLRKDIRQIGGITSYTHQRSFITLGDIPSFDQDGIWFYRGIGFTRYGTSLELIKHLINFNKNGLTKEQIQDILRIQISQQIQTLLNRDALYRIKVGNKYIYLSDDLAKNKRKRVQLVSANYLEEYYDSKISSKDLIALLKAVLLENNIKIDEQNLKRLSKKYSLKIPTKKIEQILLKYNLTEKKMPLVF